MGQVSKNDKIRIRFVQPVISEDRVGSDAAGTLSFEPAIAGALKFSSRKEITLTPDEPLTAGQAYRAKLHS